MSVRPKILLVDDEPDVLEIYQDVLSSLPSKPEIHTSTSGARAIALLEAEPFTMLVLDLKMPKMDGLQVLSIVRRKFPHLRIVVLTSATDEQYRSRAYALGIDLFWEKPANTQEVKMFQECIESLLGREDQGGFRGLQSKSLVDIIQLECLSQSSSVLKISKAGQEAKIWVLNGELIDAATGDLSGEEAFREIFSWKTGTFEILAAEPGRERTMFNSYQGLLLDSAQAMDEAHGDEPVEESTTGTPQVTGLASLARFRGVEFLLTLSGGEKNQIDSWGLENPDAMAEWVQQTQKRFRALGEKLQAGELRQVEGLGLQRHVGLVAHGGKELCVGFQRALNSEQLREIMNRIFAKWAS